MDDEHPYATLASGRPADVVLSNGGSTLYVAGEDGSIRVYDLESRTLQAVWDVGRRLGAIDISPDGSYLMVVERDPILGVGSERTIEAYKVSTSTGIVQTFAKQTSEGAGAGAFHDIAILGDGEVILTQSFSGSGSLPLWSLDTETGAFSIAGTPMTQDGTLTVSRDRTHVLMGPQNFGGALLLIYEQGVGITEAGSRGDSGGGDGGFNRGAQAISVPAGLVAQASNGLNIFDSDLDWQFDLYQMIPELPGDIEGLVFDSTGENLFLLATDIDRIVQISTSTWSIVRTIGIGDDARSVTRNDGRFGNMLTISSDDSQFVVSTYQGIQLVDNFALADVVGTAGGDTLLGSDADEMVEGLEGNDILIGSGGHDTINGRADNDSLFGGAGDDELYGGLGNDVLTGGSGEDWLDGGSGIDVVDYSLEVGTFAALVNLSSNFYFSIVGQDGISRYVVPGEALDALNHRDVLRNIENVKTGSFDDVVIGNDSANLFEAGAGHDRLDGGAGADLLFGGDDNDTLNGDGDSDMLNGDAGNDMLAGGGGNDLLVGGSGADNMRGGGGNDIYSVDSQGDTIVDGAGQGDDTLSALVSYALASDVAIEVMVANPASGTSPIALTGNDLAQSINGNEGNNQLLGLGGSDQLVGNGGNDVLVGGAGIDYMRGGLGNDVYGIDEGDIILEAAGEGDDSLAADIGSYFLNEGASIESLSTANQAGTFAQNLTGNDFGQSVSGSEGANVLNGGLGNDLLRGYGGADIFLFDTAPGAANHDVIADMAVGVDRIALQNSIFTGLAEGNLGANAFRTGAVAQDADDRIIWNAATNQLFYDADGNGAGAQVLFAIVNGSPNLQATDFIIV